MLGADILKRACRPFPVIGSNSRHSVTFGIDINPSGDIAGFDNDYINVNHGFLRSKDGTVTILDAPGAGTGFNQGTLARSIKSDSGNLQ
jgi:hypothetical protein